MVKLTICPSNQPHAYRRPLSAGTPRLPLATIWQLSAHVILVLEVQPQIHTAIGDWSERWAYVRREME